MPHLVDDIFIDRTLYTKVLLNIYRVLFRNIQGHSFDKLVYESAIPSIPEMGKYTISYFYEIWRLIFVFTYCAHLY